MKKLIKAQSAASLIILLTLVGCGRHNSASLDQTTRNEAENEASTEDKNEAERNLVDTQSPSGLTIISKQDFENWASDFMKRDRARSLEYQLNEVRMEIQALEAWEAELQKNCDDLPMYKYLYRVSVIARAKEILLNRLNELRNKSFEPIAILTKEN